MWYWWPTCPPFLKFPKITQYLCGCPLLFLKKINYHKTIIINRKTLNCRIQKKYLLFWLCLSWEERNLEMENNHYCHSAKLIRYQRQEVMFKGLISRINVSNHVSVFPYSYWLSFYRLSRKVTVLKNLSTVLCLWLSQEKYPQYKKSSSLFCSLMCSGQISWKSTNSTYSINSFKEMIFLQKTIASFRHLKSCKQLSCLYSDVYQQNMLPAANEMMVPLAFTASNFLRNLKAVMV